MKTGVRYSPVSIARRQAQIVEVAKLVELLEAVTQANTAIGRQLTDPKSAI